jgi:hypothetical protein
MSQFELVTLRNGIKTLRSVRHQETFHPTTGPFGEALILHAEQQRLRERSRQHEKFIIWDIGFGAAANVLAAISTLGEECQSQIEIHSFDRTTLPAEFAVTHASELGYVAGYERLIQDLIQDRRVCIRPGFEWHLHLGDFSEMVKDKNQKFPAPPPHSIFFDPYSAATNPEMWTLELFTSLHQRLDPQVDCLLTNYTRSTAIRVALLLSGFSVGVGCIIGDKAETTIASNHLHLIDKPLDHVWLKRVRNSLNAAPLREAQYTKSKISESDYAALIKLPQFKN